ncbi:DUF3703 domain-containing protein [Acidovorax sp. sic0104]|uniref:DUF3703 domain-containing protein n=1 Tax=Acidovorax sp. sic0104 TaxID=2854784 RepID=UPI001C43C5FC|nr:DUF3703 domain-containing protein [Acidovorax sp. sic0104]
MRVRSSTRLEAPPDWVALQLQSTEVFRHITAPVMVFTPADGAAWPTRWTVGELQVHMRLLGLLPLGSQAVRISIEPAQQAGGWPILRDNGQGRLMCRWDHRITVQALPQGATLYTDDIDVAARYLPWLMTPLSAVFAWLFFRHRQRRWRALARTLFRHESSDGPAPPPTPWRRRRAVDQLLEGFANSAGAAPPARWRWLEAAHVVGQGSLPLHWQSHCAMLHYALALRDLREAAGQLLRLALVSVGHLLDRLPRGNIGRSHVNAFKPMTPTAEVQALIDQALGDFVRR